MQTRVFLPPTAVLLFLAMLLFTACTPSSDTADECYLGMSLPAGFYAFEETSPWLEPIGPSPAIDPFSAQMMTRLREHLEFLGYPNPSLRVAYDKFTAPIHVIDADACEKVDVESSGSMLSHSLDPDFDNVAEDLPVPPQAWPDPEEDAHLVLIDPTARIAWEFWNFVRHDDGHLSAGMMGKWDLNGPGTNNSSDGERWWINGATAPRTPYIGGLVTYDEFISGEIKHALNIITANNRKTSSDSVSWDVEFCRPVASNSDGRHIGADTIPEGARIQLNPDLDLDALELSADAQVIARALQAYGAYVMDSGTAFGIKLQNLGPDSPWKEYAGILDLMHIPLSEFRVLGCDLLGCNKDRTCTQL